MPNQQLIDQISEKVKENLPPEIVPRMVKRREDKEFNTIDLDILFEVRGEKKYIAVEVKDTQSIADIREAIRRLKKSIRGTEALPFIAGRFFGERARQAIKEEDVGLIDLAGNFYLHFDDIYIEKIVDKNPFTQRSSLQNLFAPVSSRVARALLVERERVWSQQEIAEETGVSLGQANTVIRRMVKEEFLEKEKRGSYRLLKPGELLNEWTKAYKQDQNKRFVFYSFEKDLDKLTGKVGAISKKNNMDYALGYFSGALKVAPFIRGFNKVQFFARSSDELDQYKKELELSPVESGANIEIFLPYDEGVFYKLQDIDGIKIVSNIQLYLDLVNNPARGREQAQHLRDNVMKF